MKTLTWTSELQPTVRGLKKLNPDESAIKMSNHNEQQILKRTISRANSNESSDPGNWF